MVQSFLKLICAAMLLAAAYLPAARADEPLPPLGVWLQSFYESRLDKDGRATPGSDPFRSLLSPYLRARYVAARPGGADTASQDTADALTRALIYGPAAVPGSSITLIGIEERPWWQSLGHSARITLAIDGATQILIVKAYFDWVKCRWFISDIEYGGGKTLRRGLT